MKRVRPPLLLFVIGAVAGLFLTVQWHGLQQARTHLRTCNALHDRATADAHEARTLRSRQAQAASKKKPEQDVIAQINDALAAAGLPSARHFKGLRPGNSTPSQGLGAHSHQALYQRQTLHVTIEDLTPRQTGDFLVEWTNRHPLWTPTQVQLVHRTARLAETDRYDLQLTLSAIYVADS